jgi:RNA polymerase sigma-70 factor, ECF subfamily
MHDLDELFRAHGAMVYRRALRLLGNRADAEEATQEVFVRALRSKTDADGLLSVTGWLYRITTHYCLNWIRDHARRRELLAYHGAGLAEEAPERPSPADLATLRWLLASADEAQARAAVYVYLDGMSYAEAAPLLGVSKRTVGNLVARFETWARARVAAEEPSSSTPGRRTRCP